MTKSRFPVAIRKKLMDSVGDFCSAPHCRVRTAKFDPETGKKISIGDAAHIKGARGPRFDASQENSERHGFWNGIWLCGNCHRRVDQNTKLYPTDLLLRWKQKAMEDHNYQLGRPAPSYPGLDLRDELKRAKNFLGHQLPIVESFNDMIFFRSRNSGYAIPEDTITRVAQIAIGSYAYSWNNNNEHWCFFPDFHRRQAEIIRLLKIIGDYPPFSVSRIGNKTLLNDAHEGKGDSLVFLDPLAAAMFLYRNEWNRMNDYLNNYGSDDTYNS